MSTHDDPLHAFADALVNAPAIPHTEVETDVGTEIRYESGARLLIPRDFNPPRAEES